MSISESTKSTWMDVTNESVHTSDDVDIGDIEAINRDFLVVKRGFIKVHYYYIPISKVEGWDGHVVWLKITYEQVEKNYHHLDVPPDPRRYYVKSYSYDKYTPFVSSYFPEMPIIKAKHAEGKPKLRQSNSQESASGYDCPLCYAKFKSEGELSSHVKAIH